MSGVLKHTPAEIIAQLIDDVGLANLEDTGTGDPITGWTLFSNHLPPEPEQVIFVKDTTGSLHKRDHVTGVTGEHYGIQLMSRSSVDPVTPYLKLKAVSEYFDTSISRETVSLVDLDDDTVVRNYRVNTINRVTPVAPAGNDGRIFFFAFNCLVSIVLASTTETGTGS